MLFQPSYQFPFIHECDYRKQIVLLEEKLRDYAVNGQLSSFDHLPLAYEYYLCEGASASIVIVHGFTEFYQKYYEMTWYFLNQGFHVFLFDLRGHGKSGRQNSDYSVTHVEHFSDYVSDLTCFIDNIVSKTAPDVPIYLFAHSMGGAIAADYLASLPCPVQRAVLSSPMVCPYAHNIPPAIIRLSAKINARKNGWDGCFPYSGKFNPDITVENSNDFSVARFEHFLDYRIHDTDYQNSGSSNRWMYESMCVQKRLLSRSVSGKIKADVLILSAENDTVVRFRPQQKLGKKIYGAKFIRFQNSKHSIYTGSDPVLEQFYHTLFAFYQTDKPLSG